MSNIKTFNNFQTSYRKMIENASNDLTKILIEFYHHDFQSEPFLVVSGHAETIRMEEVEEYGKIINITTKENILTFTERNYHTNLSNNAIVFSSKFDDETYCIIEFM